MLKKSILIYSLLVILLYQITLQASEPRLPARGSSMEKIVSLLGQPEKKLEAVGQPPIIRWQYPGYTVYFENKLLLHTVENP